MIGLWVVPVPRLHLSPEHFFSSGKMLILGALFLLVSVP